MREWVQLRAICVALFLLLLTGCATTSFSRLTLPQVVNYYSPQAENRLVPYFDRAHVAYPPREIALLVFKQEQRLELWANDGEKWQLIKRYPIFLGRTEGAGPKLQQGDRHIPEGIYKIIALNPHSEYHLSMDLNYPNVFDIYHARHDGRYDLGDDIFIHGGHKSIGCIAVGNQAIEELFVLVYRVGLDHVEVIIAPDDLRFKKPPYEKHPPRWLPELYKNIEQSLRAYS